MKESPGYLIAGAILRASPEALQRRLREPDANPWRALADLTNTASEARLQAAALRARGAMIAALPYDTTGAVVSAAVTKLEIAINAVAVEAGGAP